ncbi:5-formyltetrahydrofolate cyclo-ligase [Levilactobacillus bambusae]|uniref:5-formyltetrahydrofolate cyclo-ligase n=1 Tax=Levilactobacillus bambusae TaxID=2024736 RepID=A0A2V1N1T8_9LACO|nr:5-formyltetrahydrofolate cyclo-ligase [Levilactobacillus bambusae]PWG01002.1 5-formyltetrahydrofolate cyclo-ligase [Levilactobacillus bambusae]
MITDKKTVRQTVIAQLKSLPKQQRRLEEQGLIDQLMASSEWQRAATVGLTMSTAIELDTVPLIVAALNAGKRVVIPQTRPNRKMVFIDYEAGHVPLKRTSYGILEPENGREVPADDIDLIIVPGLAFIPSDGTRLGFGAGYYDRYLATYSGSTIALARSPQIYLTAEWPVESFDVKLKRIITN